jgi:hypothetical protein
MLSRHPLVNAGLRHVCAIKHDAPGVGCQVPRHLRDKAGFARAVWANQRVNFAWEQIKAHMIGSAQGAEVLDQ